MPRKWERTVASLASQYGYKVDNEGKRHLKLRKANCAVIYVSSTPSDWRVLRKLRSQLRRFSAKEKGKEES